MRYQCKCGERLNNQLAPNDIQLRVYTDKEWDAIIEKDILESWKIPSPTYDVWRCPKCERVYVFDGVKLVKYYVLHDIEELKDEG